MANFVRRIVSGNKARFRDEELNLELDLVYLTDRIIIMGYPATAFEGIYRNRREDAKRFLDHRHKRNYWLFNFCPIQENSYPASAFDGRVSRYPFPDHHAPPLAVLALATREIRLWLEGSPERVAVLHCKAGKRRSGTVACAYLLSLDEHPSPPKAEHSDASKEWYDERADEWISVVAEEGVLDGVESTQKEDDAANVDTESVAAASAPGSGTVTPTSRAIAKHSNLVESTVATRATLETVLALHTQRRMQAPKKAAGKQRQGVSISSQRRWLHYWSRILSGSAPSGFWSLNSPTDGTKLKDKVRITGITLRMKEPSGGKKQVVKVANVLLDRFSRFKSGADTKVPTSVGSASDNPVWISLARYDDEFVGSLESWELYTRHDETPGRRKPGTETMSTKASGENEMENINGLFEGGRWDTSKMVRRFSTFGIAPGNGKGSEVVNTENGRTLTHQLNPLDSSKWTLVKKALVEHDGTPEPNSPQGPNLSAEDEYMTDDASIAEPSVAHVNLANENKGAKPEGTIVVANREIRAKIYFGKIPMGWFWFIPAFHLDQVESSTTFYLKRKEVDFPLGPGEWIVDVEVNLEWVDLKGSKSKSGGHRVEVAKQKSAESDVV